MNRKLWTALLCCLLAALLCFSALAEEGCAHNYSQTDTFVDYDNPSYKPNGASGHTVSYDVYIYPLCEICGNRASTSEHDEQTEEESHEFENGVCTKCGYECPHDHLGEPDEYYDESTTEFIDDTYHKVTGYMCRYYWCNDCQYGWEERDSEKTENIEKHYYIDGVCESCGHKNTCEHPNAEECYIGVSDATYKDTGSDKTHEATGTPYTEYWCEDCQSNFIVNGTGTTTIEEEHWYDENGVCEACGHKNACKHENLIVGEDQGIYDMEFTDVGSNSYHLAKGTRHYCDYCPDCGTCFWDTETTEPYEENEQHDYNSKGVCANCGHVNTCKHENADSYIYISMDNAKYEIIDAKLHKITGEKIRETWCPDCESIISTTKLGQDSDIVGHWYEEGSDTCYACGYKNTCKHKNVETYTGLWSDNITSYEEIPDDDVNHKVTGKITTEKYCLDCNATLSTEEGDVTTELWTHTYKNGVCVECGHVNACKHENTATRKDFPEGWVTSNLGAKGHKRTGPMYEVVYCTNCYEELSRKFIDENGSDIQDHYFVNGVCNSCGYKQTEEETAAPAASSGEPEPEKELVYEPVDENTEVSGVKVSDELTMEEALETIGAALDEEGVTVEIPGIDKVLSEEEMEKFNQLSVRERLMVALSALGFQDMIQAALADDPDMLSDDAVALMDDIAARVDALSDEEKAALMQLLEDLFVKDVVEIDGETYTCYCIDLVITRDGEKTYQRFAFRQDDEGQWVLARIDIGEYK